MEIRGQIAGEPRKGGGVVKRFRALYGSSIGKKAIAAVTGLIMVGFLISHLSGNLKVFLPDPKPGVADIDLYAEALRTLGQPFAPRTGVLWVVRGVLILSLVLHVISVVQLAARSRAARSTRYRGQRYLGATLPARLMLISGLLLLAYAIFHILHFTTGTVDRANFESGALYANLHRAFARWPFVALYIGGMLLVAFHLYHGAWSFFQSLGLDHPDRNRALRLVAVLLVLLLFVGYVSVPASFITGVLGPPAEEVSSVQHPIAGE